MTADATETLGPRTAQGSLPPPAAAEGFTDGRGSQCAPPVPVAVELRTSSGAEPLELVAGEDHVLRPGAW